MKELNKKYQKERAEAQINMLKLRSGEFCSDVKRQWKIKE
jgi:hypothetical protein